MAQTQESFRDFKTPHLKCRTWGHAWEATVSYVVKVERKRAYELHLACSRCTATRTDLRVHGVGLDSRSYTRPKGYDVKGIKEWGGRRLFNMNANDTLLERISKPEKNGQK